MTDGSTIFVRIGTNGANRPLLVQDLIEILSQAPGNCNLYLPASTSSLANAGLYKAFGSAEVGSVSRPNGPPHLILSEFVRPGKGRLASQELRSTLECIDQSIPLYAENRGAIHWVVLDGDAIRLRCAPITYPSARHVRFQDQDEASGSGAASIAPPRSGRGSWARWI